MPRKQSTSIVVAICLSLVCVMAQGQTLPAGWREIPPTALDAGRVFEASGLAPGEFASVRLSPRQGLSQQTLQQWTTAVFTATRQFTLNGGGQGLAVYFAVSRAVGQARLLRVLLSSEAVARGPQGVAAQNLSSELMRAELNGSLRDAAPSPVAESSVPQSTPPAFATAPGAGLRANEIESVFYHWDQRYDAFQGLVIDEAAYVLLKDGTAYDGFDLPPQDFDVVASRRADPKNWGRWRHEGNSYAFVWPRSPTAYRVPRGNPVAPSPAGLRMSGRFTGTASYTLPGGGTSTWSNVSITFSADGRFERSISGGASSSVGDTHSNSTYDDNEVVSSSATNSAVLAGKSRRGAVDDRRGSYQIEGYSIVLRHDSGKVERRAFFVDDQGAGVWLNGTRLMRDKPSR